MLCLNLERGDVCAFADELKYVCLAFFSWRSSQVAARQKHFKLDDRRYEMELGSMFTQLLLGKLEKAYSSPNMNKPIT